MSKPFDADTLEHRVYELVERNGVKAVLDALADICAGESAHYRRENQTPTALNWETAQAAIEEAASDVSV